MSDEVVSDVELDLYEAGSSDDEIREEVLFGARGALADSTNEENVLDKRDVAERSVVAATVFNTTLSYPLHFAQTLMHLGHEPLPPFKSHGFLGLGSPRYCLPGLLPYIRYIRNVDGTIGLWRGYGAYVASKTLFAYLAARFTKTLPNESDVAESDRRRVFFDNLAQKLIGSSWAILLSHPLHVIAVRCMAQFVGGETKYSSFNIVQDVSVIFREEGISGFFSGLLPHLILNVTNITISSSVLYLLQTHWPTKKEYMVLKKLLSSLIANSITYPLAVVTSIACVNNCGLEAGMPPCMPLFDCWLDVLYYLATTEQMRRGQGFFSRPFVPIAMQTH